MKQSKRSGKSPPKKREKPKADLVDGDDNVFPDDEMKQFAEMLNILNTMRDEREENAALSDIEHAHAIQSLLLEYRKQFQETVTFINNKNEPIPQNILDAIKYIDNQIAHWAGLF